MEQTMSTEQTLSRKEPLIKNIRLSFGLSALSGVLIALSMPNFNIWPLAWVALVPLLIAMEGQPFKQMNRLIIPFGLIWSVAVHNWYPLVFDPAKGYALIVAVGFYYGGVILLGKLLQDRIPRPFQVLALPIVWTAIEWIHFAAPITQDQWFVLLPMSQWQFPPALQVLPITGFPGLSFIIMLTNVAVAFLLIDVLRRRKLQVSILAALRHRPQVPALVALVVPIIIVIWGANIIPEPPAETFNIVATVDMVNQDSEIQARGELSGVGYADTPEMSQAIFDVNAELSRQITTTASPAFVVWAENEFADIDDAAMIDQLKGLAQELGVYIVADVVWHSPDGLYDTALMVGPNGQEVGRQAKINISPPEVRAGFSRGPKDYPVFDTPYGKVGLAVCYDRHRTEIIRNLARNGARIALVPVDDDFNTRWFPAIHAADSVFRAAENRLAMGLATTSGISQVIDPYGRMTARSDLYTREVIVGPTYTVDEQPLYTRVGDWFGILISVLFGVVVTWGIVSMRRK